MWNCCLMFGVITWFFIETQSRSFCKQGVWPIVNICTDDFQDNSYVQIDTASIPHFKQTSCECVISNTGQQPLELILRIVNSTSEFSMEFKINEKVINNSIQDSFANVTDNTKLLLLTQENNQTEGMCLGIYSIKTKRKFRISCKKPSLTTPIDKENEEVTAFIPIVSSLSGLLCILAVVSLGFVCYKRRKRGSHRDTTEKCSPKTNIDGDDENSSFRVGSFKGTTNGPSSVNNEFLANNETSVIIKEDGPNLSRAHSLEGSIYDSTNVAKPQQAIKHNVYDHLSSFIPTGKCDLDPYDKVN